LLTATIISAHADRQRSYPRRADPSPDHDDPGERDACARDHGAARRGARRSAARISRRLQKILDEGADPGTETTKRLLALEEEIRAILGIPHRELEEKVRAYLGEIATREPVFVKEMIQGELPVIVSFSLPSAATLRAIVQFSPIDGFVLSDWLKKMDEDDVARAMAEIRRGMALGESVRTIASRLRKHGDFTKRGAELLVRTASITIASQARSEFFKANAAIIKEEVWVATLDSLTCPWCGKLDGQSFPVGTGPHPAAHGNCRCLRVATLDGELLGTRPTKGAAEKDLLNEYAEEAGIDRVSSRARLPRGHKTKFDEFSRKRIRELIGSAPSSDRFRDFLARQTKAFQEEVLGVVRAKLFREGKLDLDDFVDDSGRMYSIDELMRREPDAFRPNARMAA
jgi:SPP1 gp7 family putative phage head morphogenesis protein